MLMKSKMIWFLVSLNLLTTHPPKKVPRPPAGTTIMPTIWAASPFVNPYCYSMNLGRKAA